MACCRFCQKLISDNAKTFIAEIELMKATTVDGEVQVRIPCWSRSRMAIQLIEGSLVGRHFEGMVKSTKRCLRKIVG